MKKRKQSFGLTDFDKYLLGEGTHEKAYEKMGAHLVKADGKSGVHFAVWAPNATQVFLIGEFNEWNGQRHPMTRDDNGIWALFVAGVKEHAVYKYRIVTHGGAHFDKADPYGFDMEQRPKTASVVFNPDRYRWQDDEWISNRAKRQGHDRPISVYEVHLGSWRRKPDEKWGSRYLTYREMAAELIPYVKEMGFTHIELLPISEYPFDASWGYQVTGYYAPTSRFGPPEDLMYLIDQCHQHGLGVFLDWVPAHFPKDGAGLNYFDGTHLYSHDDPRQGEQKDWGTLVFNLGRNEVRAFLLSNALFWIDKYHFDGLRVDAVAAMLYLDYSRKAGEWVPNQYGGNENLESIHFLRRMNEVVHGVFPGVLTLAEESTAWPMVSRPTYMGGLGFDFKWNMGWMHDTLQYMSTDAIYRRYHHNALTFSFMYAFSENFMLALSHDEVVHEKGSLLNKMAGDEWQKFATLRAYYGYMWSHPGKKTLFMGGEFGQWQEWNFESSLEWNALQAPNHQGLQRFVSDLNRLYQNEPSLHENDFEASGFSWIDANDGDNSVFSFIRYAKSSNEFIVVVSNFTPVPRHNYRVGVPEKGYYEELLNSDAERYWGRNVGNEGGRFTDDWAFHNRPYSLSLKLPPLSTILLKLKKEA